MIFSPTLQDSRVRTFLDRITPMVKESHDENCHLYHGDLSNALFWFYLGKSQQDNQAVDRGMEIIEQHVAKLSQYVYGYKFGYGIPGFAWLIQFLVSNGLLEEPEFLRDFDGLVQKSFRWNFEDHHYDLFTGYVGKALYFVERYEATGDPLFADILAQVVDAIEASSICLPQCQGRVWEDHYTSLYSSYRKGEPYYGLGLSHGIPSIIYLLCICHQLDVRPAQTQHMIREAANWLVDQKLPGGNKFADIVYTDGEQSEIHTLAWCYGTLSVCVSLYAAARVLKDDVLLAEVIRILHHCADHYTIDNIDLERKHQNQQNIYFCHGMIGLTHIFDQFGRALADERLTQCSQYWLEQTFAAMDTFPFDFSQENGDNGLMEGPAGIGVVLLDQLSQDRNYRWNKIFLTDIDRF